MQSYLSIPKYQLTSVLVSILISIVYYYVREKKKTKRGKKETTKIKLKQR